MMQKEVELEQMIEAQKMKLLAIATRIVPNLTFDDILQPQDFPSLDQHPEFRFEEGYLMGLESALATLRFKNHKEILP